MRSVGLTAEEAREEADGPADERRDGGRREADDERDARSVDEERDHVGAAAVEAERVRCARRREHVADLRLRAPREEKGAEEGDGDEEREDREPGERLRLVKHEAAQRPGASRRRGDGLLALRGLEDGAHACTRGSSLK
jgi:hypothetical protein